MCACVCVFSAGIGRTGVLILVETALCLIETNQPVFPLDIVRQMREQRLGMIQTYVCLLERTRLMEVLSSRILESISIRLSSNSLRVRSRISRNHGQLITYCQISIHGNRTVTFLSSCRCCSFACLFFRRFGMKFLINDFLLDVSMSPFVR